MAVSHSVPAVRSSARLIASLLSPLRKRRRSCRRASRTRSRAIEAIGQGALERLSPILMTALAAGIGLIPRALGAGEPGKEIQHPMAGVILRGIVTSTVLNMLVVPALYARFATGVR